MGDVLTLIEKAEQAATEEDEERARKMLKSGFDMNDLLYQLAQLRKMGSLRDVLAMMPGAANIPDEAIDEGAFRKTEAIILSMTPRERAKPGIIDAKRKRRIAAGSGTRVEDVNRLLKQFEQMNKMIKQAGRKGKRKGRMGGMPFNFGG
jgi:signal recognition particle subunit SRP54